MKAFLLLALSLAAACAHAQPYPSKPVRMIVPFGAGALDTASRAISKQMATNLGQPVYVDSMPGAGSIVGTRALVQAPKDGYTFALTNNALAINPSIIKQMPFDSVKDVEPVALIGHVPLVLLVNPALPVRNVAELVALAKSKPGGLTFGSNGRGTIIHLAGLLLAHEAGIDIRHIPYKDGGQMYADLLAGRIDFSFPATAILLQHVQAGRLRALGVTGTSRSKLMPDVPTIREAGLANYSMPGWWVMLAPTGLPRPVLDRLRESLNEAIRHPQMAEVLTSQDVTVVDSTPESTGQWIQSEMKKYEQLVKQFNVTTE